VWAQDQIVVGAMFPSNTLMEVKVPDVLISVIKNGTVVMNTIPLNAVQDGPVMKLEKNVSLPTQVMDSEVNPAAKNTVAQITDQRHTDAIPPVIHAMNAKRETLDVVQTEQPNVMPAKIQMLISYSNATKPIQIIQSVMNVKMAPQLIVMQKRKSAKAAIQKINCSHAMRRHSNANNLTILVELKRLLVVHHALTKHQQTS